MNIRRVWRNIKNLLGGEVELPPHITLGKGVHIGRNVTLDTSHGHLITLEDQVVIAPGAYILVHDSARAMINGRSWVAPVTIRKRAFIGANALILPGVTVGEDAIVGAGTVVVSDVAPGTIVAGVPARVIGSVEELDRKRRESTAKTFDRKKYNRWPLPDELLAELDSAAHEGGYFFV